VKCGFRPFFMKDAKGKRPPPINALAETILASGMFRTELRKHRA